MSYYSTVRMVTTVDGYTMMQQQITQFLEQHCCSQELNILQKEHLDYYQQDDHGVYFGWDSIRWYDQFYPEIMAMVFAIEYLEKHEIEYQFIRTGENYSDIEEIYRLKSGHLKPFYPVVTIKGGLNQSAYD